MLYAAGVDDLGSATRKSEGWSYFVIPDAQVNRFREDAGAILSRTKLSAFHGKVFARRFKDQYLAFFTLIRDHLEKSSPSMLVTTLLNENWKADYSGFIDRTIAGGLGGADLENVELVTASQSLARPLMTFQRFAQSFPADAQVRFEVDDHLDTRDLSSLTPTRNGSVVDPLLPISAMYRMYRAQKFPGAPALLDRRISVLRDEQSFLIQAADLVGNFSVAFVRMKLGDESKTTVLKASIFHDVLGDILPECDYAANVEMRGSDLVLKTNGAWTFTLG